MSKVGQRNNGVSDHALPDTSKAHMPNIPVDEKGADVAGFPADTKEDSPVNGLADRARCAIADDNEPGVVEADTSSDMPEIDVAAIFAAARGNAPNEPDQ